MKPDRDFSYSQSTKSTNVFGQQLIAITGTIYDVWLQDSILIIDVGYSEDINTIASNGWEGGTVSKTFSVFKNLDTEAFGVDLSATEITVPTVDRTTIRSLRVTSFLGGEANVGAGGTTSRTVIEMNYTYWIVNLIPGINVIENSNNQFSVVMARLPQNPETNTIVEIKAGQRTLVETPFENAIVGPAYSKYFLKEGTTYRKSQLVLQANDSVQLVWNGSSWQLASWLNST
jgi:hypothetical protein